MFVFRKKASSGGDRLPPQEPFGYGINGSPELNEEEEAAIEASRNPGIASPEYSPTISPRRGPVGGGSPSPAYSPSPPPRAPPREAAVAVEGGGASTGNLINTLTEDDMEMDLDDD